MPTNGEGAAATVEWGRLIEAVATRRDRAAFVRLFEHFVPRVKTFALRSGASGAIAEEIAQETMLTVWRKADLFVPGSTGAAAWIFAISRNLRIDALRRERRGDREVDINWETAIESRVDGQLTPESQFAAVQLEQCVRKAMAQLSSEQLRVIKLSFFEEKAHGEIAEQLQIPLGTVKSRLRLAIARLRALLGDMSWRSSTRSAPRPCATPLPISPSARPTTCTMRGSSSARSSMCLTPIAARTASPWSTICTTRSMPAAPRASCPGAASSTPVLERGSTVRPVGSFYPARYRTTKIHNAFLSSLTQ